MKPKHVLVLFFNFLVTLVLAGVAVKLFLKEQEKERIILDLQARQQLDRQKSAQAQQEAEKQKAFEAQLKLDAQRQLEARNRQIINDDLDKIDARLQRVLDAPSGFATETKDQRDTQEELLTQLADSVKTEIGMLVVEMRGAGFANEPELQENLNDFFKSYDDKIHSEHLSYDYVDLGLKDSDHKRDLDSESIKSLQAAFDAKRAIHNLKQTQPSPAG